MVAWTRGRREANGDVSALGVAVGTTYQRAPNGISRDRREPRLATAGGQVVTPEDPAATCRECSERDNWRNSGPGDTRARVRGDEVNPDRDIRED